MASGENVKHLLNRINELIARERNPKDSRLSGFSPIVQKTVVRESVQVLQTQILDLCDRYDLPVPASTGSDQDTRSALLSMKEWCLRFTDTICPSTEIAENTRVSMQEVRDVVGHIFILLTYVHASHRDSCPCNACTARRTALSLLYKIDGIDQATGEPFVAKTS